MVVAILMETTGMSNLGLVPLRTSFRRMRGHPGILCCVIPANGKDGLLEQQELYLTQPKKIEILYKFGVSILRKK